jgi:hypothetical protein
MMDTWMKFCEEALSENEKALNIFFISFTLISVKNCDAQIMRGQELHE